jgi:hypothetical protein
MRGKILLDLQELDKAYEEFKFVQDKLNGKDSYAILGVASYYYE